MTQAGQAPGAEPAPRAGYVAELVAQAADPAVGQERIRVRHADGCTEELRLHDYERLYALPGLYEQIVQERLACRSPAEAAATLARAHDAIRIPRERARIVDIAAGNGVSGEALAAEGLHPILGTDIVGAARAAALRDRPGLYDEYRTLDLVALTEAERTWLAGLAATAVSCVAPVGSSPGQVPPAALLAAARALGPDGLIAYLHDPRDGADRIGPAFWSEPVGPRGEARELHRHRYLHRRTLNGGRYVLEAVVWRLRRAG
jgi:hypothetical protein